MAEVVKVLINNVDYGPFIDISTVEASSNVNASQDGMSFTVVLNGEMPMPTAGAEVVWARFDSTTGAEIRREFGGVITEVTESNDVATLFYQVECQSYLRFFNRRLVTGIWAQQYADDMIKAIIAKYCIGFDVSNVAAPITIPAMSFNYERPSDAIEKIVKLIGYGFYVGPFRDVHVYRIEDTVSPLPGNVLDVDNDTVNYGDLILKKDASRVYNRFTLRGLKERVKTPITLSFRGDGQATQFDLGYPPSTQKGDVTVTVDGSDYPVKRDLVDGSPEQGSVPGVAYVHYSQHRVRFAIAPTSGSTIRVTFYYLKERTRTDQHSQSVSYMKSIESSAASDGVYEYSETDKTINSAIPDAVKTKFELLSTKYGFPILSGTFVTYTPGWRAGQMFKMVSAIRMGGITVDENWYVRRVTKRWIQPQHSGQRPVQYTVEFADQPYLV